MCPMTLLSLVIPARLRWAGREGLCRQLVHSIDGDGALFMLDSSMVIADSPTSALCTSTTVSAKQSVRIGLMLDQRNGHLDDRKRALSPRRDDFLLQ
jgi:hypothetical protein